LSLVDPAAVTEVVYTTYNGALIGWALGGSGSLANWLLARIVAVLSPYRPITAA
jgi:hypothetical protein